jgi:hypothetical protein
MLFVKSAEDAEVVAVEFLPEPLAFHVLVPTGTHKLGPMLLNPLADRSVAKVAAVTLAFNPFVLVRCDAALLHQ